MKIHELVHTRVRNSAEEPFFASTLKTILTTSSPVIEYALGMGKEQQEDDVVLHFYELEELLEMRKTYRFALSGEQVFDTRIVLPTDRSQRGQGYVPGTKVLDVQLTGVVDASVFDVPIIYDAQLFIAASLQHAADDRIRVQIREPAQPLAVLDARIQQGPPAALFMDIGRTALPVQTRLATYREDNIPVPLLCRTDIPDLMQALDHCGWLKLTDRLTIALGGEDRSVAHDVSVLELLSRQHNTAFAAWCDYDGLQQFHRGGIYLGPEVRLLDH